MKKVIFIFFVLLVFSCKEKEKIFNGDIVIISSPAEGIPLSGDELKLDGIYTEALGVYDSLIYFSSGLFGDYMTYVFNTKTGKHISSVARHGQGPDEFVALTSADQHYVDSSSICEWSYYDYNKKECLLIDMANNSIKKRFSISKLKNERAFPFGRVFILSDSLLLAFNQGDDIYDEGILAPPSYQIFNYLTNEEVAKYEIYNSFRYNKRLEPVLCLYSQDRMKPDRTKVAMGLHYLRQINIMDIETGKVTGYRVENTPDFDILTENSAFEYVSYYLWTCVDDDYIFALLSNNDKTSTVIDVFDWNGNFRKELVLDKGIINSSSIGIDPVNKYLYIITEGEEEEVVYRYDVSYLYQHLRQKK
ncbi:MAG: TolB-like 6-bladed beta-propeller domain-containing protein, partial [Prevotellaceae bacterium]|nr:TolB-like 6-bladed beta-propeller domain-containing protein [Prevotellaceae bacterium]